MTHGFADLAYVQRKPIPFYLNPTLPYFMIEVKILKSTEAFDGKE